MLFALQEEGSLPVFLAFLQSTSIRDLVLANCSLHMAVHDGRLSRLGRHDDSVAELLTCLPHFVCPNIVFLRLGGFQVCLHSTVYPNVSMKNFEFYRLICSVHSTVMDSRDKKIENFTRASFLKIKRSYFLTL